MPWSKDHAEFATSPRERIKHSSGLIGHGKQLTGLFTLELDTHRSKPRDGILNRKCCEHVPYEVAGAEKIVRGDDIVRHIAASPA